MLWLVVKLMSDKLFCSTDISRIETLCRSITVALTIYDFNYSSERPNPYKLSAPLLQTPVSEITPSAHLKMDLQGWMQPFAASALRFAAFAWM